MKAITLLALAGAAAGTAQAAATEDSISNTHNGRSLRWNPLAALNAGFTCALDCLVSLTFDFSVEPSRECWVCLDKTADGATVQLPPSYFRDIMPLKLGKFNTPWWCGQGAKVDMTANPTGWELQEDNGTYTGCEIAYDFIGTDSVSHHSHAKVVELLKSAPRRQEAGEIWRGNELGYIISNEIFWPKSVEPRTALLGASAKQHKVLRPILMRLFSTCNAACEKGLSDSAIKFQAEHNSIKVQADVKEWVHEELFKIIFPGKANPWPAEDFIAFQGSFTSLSTVTQLFPDVVTKLFAQRTISKANDLFNAYKPLVAEVYGAELMGQDCAPSASCLDQVTSAFVDTLIAAGGLSVPGAISTGLWALHGQTETGQAAGKFDTVGELSTMDPAAFFYESMRFFAPVVGFPFWTTPPMRATDETASQYEGGKRVVLNLALASKDPNAWGANAHEFTVREMSEYHSKFVGFADFADDDTVADGKMNRSCPGKALALVMGKQWFKNWQQDAWCTAGEPVYKETVPFIEEFTLIKGKNLGQACSAPALFGGNNNDECCSGSCAPTVFVAFVIPTEYKCVDESVAVQVAQPEALENALNEKNNVETMELGPVIGGGFAIMFFAGAAGIAIGRRRSTKTADMGLFQNEATKGRVVSDNPAFV